MIIRYLSLLLTAFALVGFTACGAPVEEGSAAELTETGTLVQPLQFQSTNYNLGLTADFNVYQNPANDCSNLGALVMEEPTDATDSDLALALLGVPTSDQDPEVCTDGTKYCLEVEDGWTLSWANLGATLSDPVAWTAIDPNDVSMTSPNPQPFEVCEGLDVSPVITFDWVDEVLVLGVGVADVMLEVDVNTCAGQCGTTASAPGDLVCALVNSTTNPSAEPECVVSCEDNSDCTTACNGGADPGLCVGGATPFPTDNPGVCYCRP